MYKFTISEINAHQNRAEWLALRQRFITATDWPKIMGSSRWGDASNVIDDKLYPQDGLESEASVPMRVGTALEPLIIQRVKEEWGDGDYLSQAFISRKRMGFTPDLVLQKADSDWVLAEIKVSVREWGDWVPEDYLDQVRFQATVLGIDEVQVVHLKLQNWAEGFQMIRAQSVPTERLTAFRVEVPERERRQIARQAEQWWKENIG